MRMKKITLTVFLLLVFTISSLGFVMTVSASPAPQLPDYEPMDISAKFRGTDIPINFDTYVANPGPGHHSYYEVGDVITMLTLDDEMGYYFFDDYELRAIGMVAEVWVQVDLSYPAGDPREYPVVTDEQIAYLLDQFDTNIYPTDTTYFGTPDYHDGVYSLLAAWGYVPEDYYVEENGRNMIMVSNVRDESYYNSSYPYYIAGFYSPSYEAYFDRNIINIDSHQWEERVGPDGNRPYLYESIIAHEYQHLIHDDYNPDDDLFMNEGCSMYAEPLCGYPFPWSDANAFLQTPDNSLTKWSDQGGINILADYGSSLMWTIYLSDHFGGADFISHFVQAGIPGIEGINAALEYFGYTDTFENVYHDWRIANLIHSDRPGYGKYNYVSIDLDEAIAENWINAPRVYTVEGLPVEKTMGSDFGTTKSYLGDDTGISLVGPYGSDYIEFTNWKSEWCRWRRSYHEKLMVFDGDDNSIFLNHWTMTDDGWYSGAGDLYNDVLYGEAYVDPANPILTVNTYWDLEDYWDFGFVQVSTDNGETWTSLENEYTTYDHDPSAHPDVVANLPGLTGWSGDFIDITFDLSAYEGETVLIGFRYVTDWTFLYEGWYIREASINGVPIELEPWIIGGPEVDFMISIVLKFDCKWHTYYCVYDMRLWDINEFGLTLIQMQSPQSAYMVVSPMTETGYSDYTFGSLSEWCKYF